MLHLGFFVLQANRFQSRITNQPSCFLSEKGTEKLIHALAHADQTAWNTDISHWLSSALLPYKEYFMRSFFFQGFVCVSKCTSTFSYPQTLACRWCRSTGRLSRWAQWNNIFLLATDPHSARRNLGDKIRERERKMTISFVIAHWAFQFSKKLCSWIQAMSHRISQIGHKTELHK